MKVNYLPRMDILDFERLHGLELLVHEREKDTADFSGFKFYCHFNHSDIKDGSVLIGKSGNGNTPDEAIADYCKQIGGGQKLVIDAYTDRRKEITTPVFTHSKSAPPPPN